jgi:hypothetical protein
MLEAAGRLGRWLNLVLVVAVVIAEAQTTQDVSDISAILNEEIAATEQLIELHTKKAMLLRALGAQSSSPVHGHRNVTIRRQEPFSQPTREGQTDSGAGQSSLLNLVLPTLELCVNIRNDRQ